jgi:hypothetical protein
MARKTLDEIFTELPKKVKHADKVALLREYPEKPMFYLLSLAYRDDVKFQLPEGAPPFKPFVGRRGAAPSDLLRECRHMYMFIEGGEPGLRQFKREMQFARMLSELDTVDAAVMVAIKDKTFEKVYRCPRKVVEEAFPGLLTHPFSIHYTKQS